MAKPKAVKSESPSELPPDWKGNPDGTPKVVPAAVALTGHGELGSNRDLATRIERAMSQAVTEALASGVAMSDSDTIRARMLAARQRVLDEG